MAARRARRFSLSTPALAKRSGHSILFADRPAEANTPGRHRGVTYRQGETGKDKPILFTASANLFAVERQPARKITAGGLLFIGAAKDAKFRAFDKASGKVLWETRLPAGGKIVFLRKLMNYMILKIRHG